MLDTAKTMTAAGLARELRLPREWLITEADAGRLPCLRVGKKRLFNLNAVRVALAERAAATYAGGPADE